jgi:hypothetical protein
MPTTINLVDGTASAHLNAGDHFAWQNPTTTQVVVGNCSEFCTASSYTVPGQSEVAGQITQNPAANWTFTETPSVWRPGVINPGAPHVQNPPVMHRDVA